MAKQLTAIGQTRPRLISQGEEAYSVLRMIVREVNQALQAGKMVKIDGLARLGASLKVGGEVGLVLRGDRAAVAA